MSNRVPAGWGFEFAVVDALGNHFRRPIQKNDHFEKRKQAWLSLSEGLRENQLFVAQRAVGRIPFIDPRDIQGLSITDGAPDDLCIHRGESSIYISVKWSDGINEVKGSRIGTGRRGDYQLYKILGIPAMPLWTQTLKNISRDLREAGGKCRADFGKQLITHHLALLADITHYQFEWLSGNSDFAQRLIESIFGKSDVVYITGSAKRRDATVKVLRTLKDPQITSCQRFNSYSVRTMITDAGYRHVEISHRVKVKEARRMNARVSDYAYNIAEGNREAVSEL